MQGRNGVARASHWEGFDEQFVNLGQCEVLPGETILKDIDGPHRGKKIVKKNTDRTGDEKCRHRGETAARVAQQEAGINDGNDNGQADIKSRAEIAKRWKLLKPLADYEGELDA